MLPLGLVSGSNKKAAAKTAAAQSSASLIMPSSVPFNTASPDFGVPRAFEANRFGLSGLAHFGGEAGCFSKGRGLVDEAIPAISRAPWKSSKRSAPCPICGRDIDNKCRWSEGIIACHQGDRFGPPSGLRLGDVLEIQGRRWAVCSLSGGFAKAAVIFRPHTDRREFTPRQRRQRMREQAVLEPVLLRLFDRCREQFQTCLGMPELVFLKADEILAELDHARATFRNLTALRQEMVKARRESPGLARYVKALDRWLKLTRYQLRDVEVFMRIHLGTPTSEQIVSLEIAQ